MTDQLLNVLKLALLALIYLFFGRVLWAVWSEVRTPVAAAGARIRRTSTGSNAVVDTKAPRGATTFVVLEPRDQRGHRFVLETTITIGRHEANAISLPDDTYISGTHARIDTRNGDVVISDLNSTNGTFVNGTRVSGDRVLRKGDRIQTGTLVMEMQQ